LAIVWYNFNSRFSEFCAIAYCLVTLKPIRGNPLGTEYSKVNQCNSKFNSLMTLARGSISIMASCSVDYPTGAQRG
jgi:hypothetical protein